MMFSVIHTIFTKKLVNPALVCVGVFVSLAVLPLTVRAQRTQPMDGNGESAPSFSDFKGVKLGMTADETRKKLGNPRDKSPEQDFYLFSDTQAVQVLYDKKGSVSAISIDFMSGASGVPAAKDILGVNADSNPDGSMYKMVRYPKAGYWVSYNRTKGDSPTVTIIMQRIDH
jgi:hypothetical protein